MAKLFKSDTAQTVLEAEFTFNFDDEMTDVNGVLKDFKTVGSNVFDVIGVPPDSTIVGGELVTETAVTGSTAYNIKVGDGDNDARYLSSTDKISAGRTALVPTGYRTNGKPIRITVSPTVAAATAGRVTLRVLFVMRGRANENIVG